MSIIGIAALTELSQCDSICRKIRHNMLYKISLQHFQFSTAVQLQSHIISTHCTSKINKILFIKFVFVRTPHNDCTRRKWALRWSQTVKMIPLTSHLTLMVWNSYQTAKLRCDATWHAYDLVSTMIYVPLMLTGSVSHVASSRSVCESLKKRSNTAVASITSGLEQTLTILANSPTVNYGWTAIYFHQITKTHLC